MIGLTFFLTSVAEEKNWKDKGNFKDGLQTGLVHLQNNGTMKCQFEPVPDIPEGFTSAEIWELFQAVLKKIEPGDEIYLDITHAFRHIPMLALTIMNFAVAVKRIQLKAIYYGAFEKILNDYEKETGEKIFLNQIETKIPEDKRLAPVLNLSVLEQLQQWSFAAQSFVITGNSFFVSDLALQQAQPLLAETLGKHDEAKHLKEAANLITAVTASIATCRGKKIQQKIYLAEAIAKVKALKTPGTFANAKPFEELLDTIAGKLSRLDEKNFPAWFNAVRWCRRHRLIQQGITLLQEGIITHVLQQFNGSPKLNWGIKEDRDIVAAAFYILARKTPKEKWNEKATENEAFIKKVLAQNKIEVLSKVYDAISEKRNYINHGGFLENDYTTSNDFENALKICIVNLETNYFNPAT